MSFQWKDSYLKSIQWQCKKYFSAFQEDILYKYWQRSGSLKLTVNVKKRKNPFLSLDRKCWGENGNICPLPTWINLLKSIRHDISRAGERESGGCGSSIFSIYWGILLNRRLNKLSPMKNENIHGQIQDVNQNYFTRIKLCRHETNRWRRICFYPSQILSIGASTSCPRHTLSVSSLRSITIKIMWFLHI